MKKELIVAGFGGQGALAIGKNLAEAGMAEGLNVTWAPSYGPEMRGGTANCSVVLSTERVGSPVFARPSELIVLNLPSLLKFQDDVQPGGMIFVNSSVIEEKVERQDVTTYYVPCSEIAEKVGNPKASNMDAGRLRGRHQGGEARDRGGDHQGDVHRGQGQVRPRQHRCLPGRHGVH